MATRLAVILVLLVAGPIVAQPERYELGQRLKTFEKAWDKYPDPAGRKRALEILPNVTTQFFTLNLGGAGRTLDEARWRLESKDEPSDAVKWLTSLYANPEKRLYDASVKEMKVVIKHFYKVKGEIPNGMNVTIRIGQGSPVAVSLKDLPVTVTVPFPLEGWEGDWPLIMEAKHSDREILSRVVIISTMKDLSTWMDEAKANVSKDGPFKDDISKRKNGVEIATWRDRIQFYTDCASGEVPENDISTQHMGEPRPIFGTPKGSFTAKQEYELAITAARLGKRWYCTGSTFHAAERVHPGDFSLSLPLTKSRSMPFRLSIPSTLTLEKTVPLVIALHGAGGTENLFFEGYGDGIAVKECQKRGWILVAPRSTLNFTGAPPLNTLIDELATRFPIDHSKVFILGHSMGAMQTIAACQENPGLFKAAAALGGGGRVKNAKLFETLPVFVGVGDKDFALSGAKSLAKTLTDGGAKNVTYKEYPDLEHLVIVREALPDVFKMFDAVLAEMK